MQINDVKLEARTGVTTAAIALLKGYRAQSIKAFLVVTDERWLDFRFDIPQEWFVGVGQIARRGPLPGAVYVVENYTVVDNIWSRIFPGCADFRTHMLVASPSSKMFIFESILPQRSSS